MAKFIITLDGIRDAQAYWPNENDIKNGYQDDDEFDPYEEEHEQNWVDVSLPMFVGVYDAETEEEALKIAAKEALYEECMLTAELVPGTETPYVLSTYISEGEGLLTQTFPTKDAAQARLEELEKECEEKGIEFTGEITCTDGE